MRDTRPDTTPLATTHVHHHDGIAVIEVVGEIDMACERPIRATLAEQLEQRPTGLVVDLTRIDFFGSAGIQLLVEAVAGAARRGVALAVATDRRTVLRPLEITLVDRTVDIHPTRTDALAALRGDHAAAPQRMAHQQ